jgi:hypothetical protein
MVRFLLILSFISCALAFPFDNQQHHQPQWILVRSEPHQLGAFSHQQPYLLYHVYPTLVRNYSLFIMLMFYVNKILRFQRFLGRRWIFSKNWKERISFHKLPTLQIQKEQGKRIPTKASEQPPFKQRSGQLN